MPDHWSETFNPVAWRRRTVNAHGNSIQRRHWDPTLLGQHVLSNIRDRFIVFVFFRLKGEIDNGTMSFSMLDYRKIAVARNRGDIH